MSILDLIKKSRTVRSYDEEKKISESQLINLIECARFSPTACNFQPLKFRIVTKKEDIDFLVNNSNFASNLKDIKLPGENHFPSGFIMIYHDTSVCPVKDHSYMNAGIAAQSMNIALNEMDFGACMIYSFNKEKSNEYFNVPENLVPMLILSIGSPAEHVETTELKDGTSYFRINGVHYVPKRSIEELIIK